MLDWKDLTTDQKLDQLYVDLVRTMNAVNALTRQTDAAGLTLSDLSERLRAVEKTLPRP